MIKLEDTLKEDNKLLGKCEGRCKMKKMIIKNRSSFVKLCKKKSEKTEKRQRKFLI